MASRFYKIGWLMSTDRITCKISSPSYHSYTSLYPSFLIVSSLSVSFLIVSFLSVTHCWEVELRFILAKKRTCRGFQQKRLILQRVWENWFLRSWRPLTPWYHQSHRIHRRNLWLFLPIRLMRKWGALWWGPTWSRLLKTWECKLLMTISYCNKSVEILRNKSHSQCSWP